MPLLTPSCSTTYTDTSCTPEPSSVNLHKTYDKRGREHRIPTPNSSHPHQGCPFPAAGSGLNKNCLRPSMDRAHGSARLKRTKGRHWGPCCVGGERRGTWQLFKTWPCGYMADSKLTQLGSSHQGALKDIGISRELSVLCRKNQPQTHPARGKRSGQ